MIYDILEEIHMHVGVGLWGRGGVGERNTAVRLSGSVEIWISDVAGPCLVPFAEY